MRSAQLFMLKKMPQSKTAPVYIKMNFQPAQKRT
jgi:hypothetical protein